MSPTQTKVTANTRYVVQRQLTITLAANNIPQSSSDNISFNSGSSGAFAPNSSGQGTECVAMAAKEGGDGSNQYEGKELIGNLADLLTTADRARVSGVSERTQGDAD